MTHRHQVKNRQTNESYFKELPKGSTDLIYSDKRAAMEDKEGFLDTLANALILIAEDLAKKEIRGNIKE